MQSPFEALKARSAEDWQRYCEHRFVRELAAGTLSEASFRHFLKQDYLFLVHFARAWGLAVYKSRDLAEIQALLHDRRREFSQQAATAENAAWRAARSKWEGEPVAEWKFGDLPASVRVEEKHGVPVLAYPGLKALEGGALAAHPGSDLARIFGAEEALNLLQADAARVRELVLERIKA